MERRPAVSRPGTMVLWRLAALAVFIFVDAPLIFSAAVIWLLVAVPQWLATGSAVDLEKWVDALMRPTEWIARKAGL